RAKHLSACCQLYFLWMVGLALSWIDDRQHHGRLLHRTEDLSRLPDPQSQMVALVVAGVELHDSGHFQILRFFRGITGWRSRAVGDSQRSSASDPHHPPTRDLLLYVRGSCVYPGCLSGQDSARRFLCKLRIIHKFLPAPDRGSDPKAEPVASADSERKDIRGHPIFRWPDADCFWTGAEMRDRGQLCSPGQCCVRGSIWPIQLLDCADRSLRVRLASVRRLQRLQRHGTWVCAAAGFSSHGQFSAAVPGAPPSGFLAALAYQFEHLASRLP